MYRVGLVTERGGVISGNFNTREEADDFILMKDGKYKVKYYRILNKDTGERESEKF